MSSPQLDDLRAWRAWSPWREDAYPGLVFRYAGPPRGAGAEVSWDSKATGDGRLRIVESVPPRRLAFTMAFQTRSHPGSRYAVARAVGREAHG